MIFSLRVVSVIIVEVFIWQRVVFILRKHWRGWIIGGIIMAGNRILIKGWRLECTMAADEVDYAFQDFINCL